MKNKKILIVIIFLLVVLMIAGGVYAYMTLDMFRSPKQLFGKYLQKQVVQIENINTGALKTILENFKTKTSNTEYNIKLEDETSNSTELKVGLKNDPVNSTALLNLKLNNNDNEFANYSLYADKEKIALNIPELNDKYFSVKIDTLLEEIQQNLNDNNVTEKEIDLSKENIEKYKNEIKELYKKYSEDVKNNLTEDKFTAEKKVTIDVNGSSITANKYTLSLTAYEVQSMFFDIIEKIADEPIITDFMTEDEISEFKEKIADAKENIEESDKEKVLKVCIYEEKGNTVKIELQSDDEVIAEFMNVINSDTENIIICNMVIRKTNETDVGENQSIVYTINVEDQNTTSVTVKTSTTYNKDDVEALKEYYEDNDFYTEEDIEERYKDITTSQKSTITLNGDKATAKITSDAFENLGYNNVDLKINYSFGEQFNFDELSDSIDLDDYRDNEELQAELIQECMTNLQNNPNSLLGMMFASYTNGISSLFNTDDSTGNTADDINDNIDINVEKEKVEIEQIVKDSLTDCLDSYKRDLEEDENTNVADYLTVSKISEMIVSSHISDLELIDGSTLKVKYDDKIYYVTLVINSDSLEIEEVKAFTESEYNEL